MVVTKKKRASFSLSIEREKKTNLKGFMIAAGFCYGDKLKLKQVSSKVHFVISKILLNPFSKKEFLSYMEKHQ